MLAHSVGGRWFSRSVRPGIGCCGRVRTSERKGHPSQLRRAPIAQRLEQRAYTSCVPDKHMVLGSNPSGGTGGAPVAAATGRGSGGRRHRSR